MKNSSLVALCIALAGNGMASADELAPSVAVQRVVASIRADAASEFDCVADDDSHRYQAPPAPQAVVPASPAVLAAAEKRNRQHLARIERELRNTSLPR